MAIAGRVVALCALAVSLLLIAAVALRVVPEGANDPWLPRYDLREPSLQVRLAGALTEVSGLALDGRGRLLAHEDENAIVYVVDPVNGATVRTLPIGDRETRGDFEGIAVAGERIFLVTARGTLLEVRESPGGRATIVRTVTTDLDRICEVEGLAYDAAGAALLLPCKSTRGKQLDDRLLIYAVPLGTLELDPRPRLDVAHADLRAAGLSGKFHPSAIEVHPRSGSFFVVAGRESAIVEISPAGQVLAARQLSRKAHPQPEGIAFGADLELWIADERASGGGTLTRYRLAEDAPGRD